MSHPSPLPPLPGLDQLGVGIDMVTGTRMANVLDLSSFSRNLTVRTSAGDLYAVPDSVAASQAFQAGVDAMLFTSASEYTTWAASDTGAWLWVPLDSISAVLSLSAQSSSVREQLSANVNALALVQEQVLLYSAQVSELAVLNVFSQSVAHLPQTYDAQSYAEFVQYFGTHVVTTGQYGGLARATAYLEWSFLEGYGSSVAALNAKLKYAGLKRGVGVSFNRAATTLAFETAGGSSMQVDLVGGEDSLPIAQWNQWLSTVRERPSQVRYRVSPLSALITDPTVRSNLERYLQAYLAANQQPVLNVSPPNPHLGACDCHFSTQSGRCDRGAMAGGQAHEWHHNQYLVNYPYCCSLCFSFSELASFNSSEILSESGAAQRQAQQPQNDQTLRVRKRAEEPHEEEKKEEEKEGDDEELDSRRFITTPTQQQSALTPLPGLDQLGVGFDAARGELLSAPLIELSYTSGAQWYSEATGQWYLYPDQVSTPRVPNDATQTLTTVSRSATEVSLALAQRSGFTVGLPGLFGMSIRARTSTLAFQSAQSLVAMRSDLTTYYEASLQPAFLLNTTTTFERAWRALPTSLSGAQNQSAYAAFVQMFGTHVVFAGTYGGEAVLETRVDAEYYTSHSESEIQDAMSALFVGFQSGNVWSSSNSDFNSASFAEFQLSGGQYATFSLMHNNTSAYDSWVNSTAYYPAQVARQLWPIDLLLPSNSTQRALLAAYITGTYMPSNALPDVPPIPTNFSISSNATITPDALCEVDLPLLASSTIYKDNSFEYWEWPIQCQNAFLALDLNTSRPVSPAGSLYNSTSPLCPPNMFMRGSDWYHPGHHDRNYLLLPIECWFLSLENQ
eukprot:CAMPEP_0174243070 /NCGR_PEP_ID=MMETSP0417-20130205/30231_1 /TAXON_ID=242541 /ORGANISM="Mayorella sp, Strain BSH-02190019" /LENGTH=845 /DNA_ID=CAMNT_0015322525 /DNA_START=141 /DNA_END=2678 /DNA_ORIENTATION=+